MTYKIDNPTKVKPVEHVQIERSLNWRYATKAYDPAKKISESDWNTILDSIRLAPSSFGLQPYKFVVISDTSIRKQIRAAASGQGQATDASHLIVFAYKLTLTETDVRRYIDLIAAQRGQERSQLADFESVLNAFVAKLTSEGRVEAWTSRQVYIPLGFMLETAALLGVDATPMEGFDVEAVNDILGLTDYSAAVIAAAGYRDAANDWLANLPKVRMPDESLFESR